MPTREDAEDWQTLIRAKTVSGSLPRRISVSDYAARWMSTYDTAPTPTRSFPKGNLDRYILPVLGPRSVADVTPTEISRLVNGLVHLLSHVPMAAGRPVTTARRQQHRFYRLPSAPASAKGGSATER